MTTDNMPPPNGFVVLQREGLEPYWLEASVHAYAEQETKALLADNAELLSQLSEARRDNALLRSRVGKLLHSRPVDWPSV